MFSAGSRRVLINPYTRSARSRCGPYALAPAEANALVNDAGPAWHGDWPRGRRDIPSAFIPRALCPGSGAVWAHFTRVFECSRSSGVDIGAAECLDPVLVHERKGGAVHNGQLSQHAGELAVGESDDVGATLATAGEESAWRSAAQRPRHVHAAQRLRIIRAVARLATERDLAALTTKDITATARVSTKTFYDLFEDRTDCVLDAVEHARSEARDRARVAYETPSRWGERLRAGLGALLTFFDEEPELAYLCVAAPPAAGPAALERHQEVLQMLARLVDHGRYLSRRQAPPFTAEGVVGGVLGVVHTRLLEPEREPLIDLLDPLMSMIVLPYRGLAAARKELHVSESRRAKSLNTAAHRSMHVSRSG